MVEAVGWAWGWGTRSLGGVTSLSIVLRPGRPQLPLLAAVLLESEKYKHITRGPQVGSACPAGVGMRDPAVNGSDLLPSHEFVFVTVLQGPQKAKGLMEPRDH